MRVSAPELWTSWTIVLLLSAVLGGSITAPDEPGAGPAAAWDVSFEDVAAQSGMPFRHAGEIHDPQESDFIWPAFPEIMGSGACWGDFTGDGYEDLYVTNQRFNEENPYAQGFNEIFDPHNAFYVNEGDGTFTERAAAAGLQSPTYDQGCTAADHDGDGHLDLFVTGFGQVAMHRNEGDGSFTEVTSAAGLDRSTACLPFACWNTCSAWGDYDGDGWLDLFVCTYVESDMEDDDRGPARHNAQYNALYRNNGDGTFTERAHEAGVAGIAADELGSKSLGVVWFDADLDGWPDLYVANDNTPNELYWNNGDGTFTRDDEAGLYNSLSGMGLTSGDFDADGHPDLYFTHYQRQNNGFYRNDQDRTWTDLSGLEGHSGDYDFVGWGTRFVDLDRDGLMDVVAVNGHTNWVSPIHLQETLVVRQEPDGQGGTIWVDRTHSSGPGILQQQVSRGAAFADATLDGNVDIAVVNNNNESLQFLRGSGASGHWLYVQPVQEGPNHQAVGARVAVETPDGRVQHHEVRAGSSFLSQDSLLADFGLGVHDRATKVTVHWPHGNTTVVEDVPADRVVRIDRATGTFTTDTLSPATQVVLFGQQGQEGWFRSAVDAQFVAQDRAVGPASGVAWTEYRIDGGPWTKYDGDAVHFPAEPGEHVLDYRSADTVGNLEPLHREPIGIDLTPPEAGHEIEGTPASNGWWEAAELVLWAHDEMSGVARIEYRVDGGPWSVYEEPVPFGEGEHGVDYRAVDRAGNIGTLLQVVVRVDGSPPDMAFLHPEEGTLYWGNAPMADLGSGPAIIVATPDGVGEDAATFDVHVDATDLVSGLDRVTLFLGGEPVAGFRGAGPHVWSWNTTQYPSGTVLLEGVAQDEAGLVALESVLVMLVSATPQGILKTLQEGPSTDPL